ncbi:DUF6036 family nucleotidyltransferase [Fictibacillus sp. NRS-1165]|uniref:DUF6036 family nucleotidyltransferase n=1 Tax=Fictibacillus sp. NRS-1165 TaxID=3144463 RepID=UPI003D1E960F
MSKYDYVLRNADDILDKLETLDYLCLQQRIVADLLIVGGSGILLFMEQEGREFRPTRDVDVNLLDTNDQKALFALLSDVGIEVVGGVMEVPPMEDFRDTESLFKIDSAEFSAINVYVPTIEMLACTKIFSKREKDLFDLRETQILESCNLEKLLFMVEEYRGYVTNPNHPDLNLHQLVDIIKEKVV